MQSFILENGTTDIVIQGQLEKAKFNQNAIFAPQGDYSFFQCEKSCSQNVYNKQMIDAMLKNKNMTTPYEIRQKKVPLKTFPFAHVVEVVASKSNL